MKSNVLHIFATVVTAIVIGLSVMLASPLSAAACTGCSGGGGIFRAPTTTTVSPY